MSEAVQLAIVQGIVVIFTTLGGLVVAWLNLRGRMIEQAEKNDRRAAEAKKDMGEMKENVAEIKKETNHMKDALVLATREGALLEGADTERIRARDEKAVTALAEKALAEKLEQVVVPGIDKIQAKVEATAKDTMKQVIDSELAIKNEIKKGT